MLDQKRQLSLNNKPNLQRKLWYQKTKWRNLSDIELEGQLKSG